MIDATEELMQGAAIMVRIEEVIEAFTDRGDGTARRDRGLEERCDAKLGGGRLIAKMRSERTSGCCFRAKFQSRGVRASPEVWVPERH